MKKTIKEKKKKLGSTEQMVSSECIIKHLISRKAVAPWERHIQETALFV